MPTWLTTVLMVWGTLAVLAAFAFAMLGLLRSIEHPEYLREVARSDDADIEQAEGLDD